MRALKKKNHMRHRRALKKIHLRGFSDNLRTDPEKRSSCNYRVQMQAPKPNICISASYVCK
jgi:hypothetical protein